LMECIRVSSHWFAALPGAFEVHRRGAGPGRAFPGAGRLGQPRSVPLAGLPARPARIWADAGQAPHRRARRPASPDIS
jgi:hypothetical protein